MIVNFKKISFWILSLILTILMLFIISLILLAAQTNPLTFLEVIFWEPWKNIGYFSGFVNIFAVLLLVALSVAITFKYKIYNFGVPGQMLVSAMITYITAVAIVKAGGTDRAIVIFLLFMAIIVGAFIGLIIALLKNYFRINEIISTILFNFIAWEGYKGLIADSDYQNQTMPVILSLRFSLKNNPFSASNLFSAGIIIALIVLLITILLFNNRIFGFKLNVISKNSIAAKQARIEYNYQILKLLPISGAIAGLAGYLYLLSTNNTLPKFNSIPQEGFYAIVIAALVFYEPSIIIFSNFIFTLFIRPIHFKSFIYLKNSSLIIVVLSIAIYLMGFFPYICYLWDQSPFIQEKWFKIKRKLFKIATPIQEEIPYLEQNKREQKVETLNLDLENIKNHQKKFHFKKNKKEIKKKE